MIMIKQDFPDTQSQTHNTKAMQLLTLKYVATNMTIQSLKHCSMHIRVGKLYSNNYMYIIMSFRGSTELK